MTSKLQTKSPGKAILATPQAAEDDATAAAVRGEHLRYERAILDFESEVVRRRDAMRREHLDNLHGILNGGEEE